MAEKSRFFNSTTSDERLYDAADMAEVWNTFFTNGVISGLEVSSTSSGLSVSAGSAIINGYWYKLDSAKTLAIASGTSEHTDTVVLKLDLGSEARNITAVYKSETALTESHLAVQEQQRLMMQFRICTRHISEQLQLFPLIPTLIILRQTVLMILVLL